MVREERQVVGCEFRTVKDVDGVIRC
jgi:hypothetical protein